MLANSYYGQNDFQIENLKDSYILDICEHNIITIFTIVVLK